MFLDKQICHGPPRPNTQNKAGLCNREFFQKHSIPGVWKMKSLLLQEVGGVWKGGRGRRSMVLTSYTGEAQGCWKNNLALKDILSRFKKSNHPRGSRTGLTHFASLWTDWRARCINLQKKTRPTFSQYGGPNKQFNKVLKKRTSPPVVF